MGKIEEEALRGFFSRRFVKATTMVVTDYGCDADGKVKALCNRPTQLQCTFVVT